MARSRLHAHDAGRAWHDSTPSPPSSPSGEPENTDQQITVRGRRSGSRARDPDRSRAAGSSRHVRRGPPSSSAAPRPWCWHAHPTPRLGRTQVVTLPCVEHHFVTLSRRCGNRRGPPKNPARRGRAVASAMPAMPNTSSRRTTPRMLLDGCLSIRVARSTSSSNRRPGSCRADAARARLGSSGSRVPDGASSEPSRARACRADSPDSRPRAPAPAAARRRAGAPRWRAPRQPERHRLGIRGGDASATRLISRAARKWFLELNARGAFEKHMN